MDGSALDKEGTTYMPAWDAVKGTPANVIWERLDLLDFIGL